MFATCLRPCGASVSAREKDVLVQACSLFDCGTGIDRLIQRPFLNRRGSQIAALEACSKFIHNLRDRGACKLQGIDHLARWGTPIVDASSIERCVGFSESPSDLRTIYCACVPSRETPNPAPLPQTSLPFQPSPATTTPAKSRPGMRGREAPKTPATFFTSLGLMAEACSSTSASPDLRSGTGTSWIERTDGGPYFSKRRAFIVVIWGLLAIRTTSRRRAREGSALASRPWSLESLSSRDGQCGSFTLKIVKGPERGRLFLNATSQRWESAM